MMWLISAPSSTTSEPALIGMCLSDTADVRVKRGSTWITRAPRAFGFLHPLEPHSDGTRPCRSPG